MKVGIIGAGMLGSAVGMRMITKGAKLVVYNRTISKTKKLSKAGAIIKESAADVAIGCDLVITCVTNADALEKVCFGPSGLVKIAKDCPVICDMSTIRPSESKEITEKLKEHSSMLGSPVIGPRRIAFYLQQGIKSIRLHFDNVFSDPETIMTSLPAIATSGPPITGVPSIVIECSLSFSVISLDSLGLIVLISQITGQSFAIFTSPLGPKHTFSSASAFVTHVMTRSHPIATSAALSLMIAPALESFLVFEMVRLYTTSFAPFVIMRMPTAEPSIPAPMIPTFTA